MPTPTHNDTCACCGDAIDPYNFVFTRGNFWCLPCNDEDTRVPTTEGFDW